MLKHFIDGLMMVVNEQNVYLYLSTEE